MSLQRSARYAIQKCSVNMTARHAGRAFAAQLLLPRWNILPDGFIGNRELDMDSFIDSEATTFTVILLRMRNYIYQSVYVAIPKSLLLQNDL